MVTMSDWAALLGMHSSGLRSVLSFLESVGAAAQGSQPQWDMFGSNLVLLSVPGISPASRVTSFEMAAVPG